MVLCTCSHGIWLQCLLGINVHINHNCTFVDTCPVTIGIRTLIASEISLYSGTHPLDPDVTNGTRGPETGNEIVVGEDRWTGGHSIILLGVELGRSVVVGAGRVVTKVSPVLIESFRCQSVTI
jgi:acetyltransferase-like isoleucine patch superfamily enzyme